MLNRLSISFFALCGLLLLSCGTDDNAPPCPEYPCIIENGGITVLPGGLGWIAENEDIGDIQEEVYVSDGDLPGTISLEDKFPPIGDQGRYGTCVAWSAGYNLKTALNAIEKGWSSADLSIPENQTSPKDLWFALEKKGARCDGASLSEALKALASKGAASLNSVPYEDLGTCSGRAEGDEDNRIESYSVIAYNYALTGRPGSRGMTLENFKGYLSQEIPILVGAKVGDRFMRWNSSAVIKSDTYNDPDMQHAFHAMVLAGYDDEKEAFRLRNAWGANWGDYGSIWVGYDFFLNSFCYMAFIARNR